MAGFSNCMVVIVDLLSCYTVCNQNFLCQICFFMQNLSSVSYYFMTCMAICGHVYFYLHDLCVYIYIIYMIFVMNLLNPPTLFLLLNIFKVEEIMNLYGFIVYHFYDLITLQGILQKKKVLIFTGIYIYMLKYKVLTKISYISKCPEEYSATWCTCSFIHLKSCYPTQHSWISSLMITVIQLL